MFFFENQCEFDDFEIAFENYKKTNTNFAYKIKEKDTHLKHYKREMEFAKVDYPDIPED